MAVQTLLFVFLCSSTLRLSPRGLSFWVNLGPHSTSASGQSNCLFGDWRLPAQVFQSRKKSSSFWLFTLVPSPYSLDVVTKTYLNGRSTKATLEEEHVDRRFAATILKIQPATVMVSFQYKKGACDRILRWKRTVCGGMRCFPYRVCSEEVKVSIR